MKWPTVKAERRHIRKAALDAAVSRARDGYLLPFVSLRCGGDVHADMADGCANDGTGCLCDCHDSAASLGSTNDVFTRLYNRLGELTDGYPKPALQEQIAQFTGVAQQNVARYIAGTSLPKADLVDWAAVVRTLYSLGESPRAYERLESP